MNKWKKGIKVSMIAGLAVVLLTGCGVLESGRQELISYLESRIEEREKEGTETEDVEEEISEEDKKAEEEAKKAEEEAKKAEEEAKKAEEEAKKAEEEAEKAKEQASEEIRGSLKSIVEENQSGGDFAAYTYGLESEIGGDYDSHQMQAASLIKLYIAGTVYENWDTLKAQESWDGELYGLLSSMITVSDNDASNNLIYKLGNGDASAGMAAVNEYCDDYAYEDTHLGRLLLASNEFDDNYTSVKDCGAFLEAVYNNEIEGAEEILGLLKQQQRTGKIPAGVPGGVQTANKTGELSNVENDAAIIWGDEPYILVVMSQSLPDAGSARYSIVNISSEVYEMWENR